MQHISVVHQETATKRGQFTKLIFIVAILAIVASLIGPLKISLGFGKVVLLPMVWAMILGAVVGIVGTRQQWFGRFDAELQFKAGALLQPALLMFTAKLGLMVGYSLPKVVHAGWALAFQEFGHFLGTILVGLPLALVLGIKREAIGATFSVGREPSLAIIGDRYGMNSPEGCGVLAEYLTGTIFGAVFIALFAGFVTSLGILDPVALAMGAGVGSGSMMAAASGAIAALQTPEVAKQVATFAAASNLITSTLGVYFTLFISLPCAVRLYEFLEPKIGRATKASGAASSRVAVEKIEEGTYSLLEKWVTWLMVGAVAITCNAILTGTNALGSVPCMLVILVVLAVSNGIVKIIGGRLPAVCIVSLVAMALTSPWCPWAQTINAMSSHLDFLSVTPPMLALAGLSIAKDIPAFRKLGWRIVLVSFVANAGSFLVASLVAQFFHH
ncbi:DUF3100 domain-containing protein [Paraburkholderia ferrariae]|uniref:DUF3100 domain-containing protein n=1 Tax=Paraburkholderia ferrariae TaxID=386056 RepID=A0ABU9RM85_9BURK